MQGFIVLSFIALSLLSFCDKERRHVAEFMRVSILFCSKCKMSSLEKFTFAISSADKLLLNYFTCAYTEVLFVLLNASGDGLCAWEICDLN